MVTDWYSQRKLGTMDSRKKAKTVSKLVGRFNSSETAALSRIFSRITDTGRMDRSQFRDVLHSTFDMNDDSLMDRMFRTFDSDADGYLNCKEWLYGLWIFLKGNLVEKATYSFQIILLSTALMSELKPSLKGEARFEGFSVIPQEACYVYDVDGDGYLCKADIFQLLKTSFRHSVPKVVPPKNRVPESSAASSVRLPQPEDPDSRSDQDGFQYLQGELNSVAIAGGNVEDDPDEGARDLSDMAIALLDKDKDGRVSMTDFLASVNEDNLLLEILGPCLPSAARATAVLSALNSSLSLLTNQSTS